MSSNLKVNNILPSTGDTVAVSGIASITSSVSIASSCTATTFYGSGANLTSLPSQVNITNNADNRIITGGSGTNLNGEANLTFDGTNLTSTVSGNSGIVVAASGNNAPQIKGQANRGAQGNTLLSMHGVWNGTDVTMIDHQAGADTTNKDDGQIGFYTKLSGGSMGQRLHIGSDGTTTFDPSGGGTLKIGGSSAHTSKIVIADNAGNGNGNCLVEGGDGTDFFTIQSNGNVAFENGKGINFGASAGSGASSSILDDYEEGTWTPQTATNTLSYGDARYTKIGRMVYITAYVNGFTNRTSTNNIQITNLPFTSDGLGDMVGTAIFYRVANTDDAQIGALMTGATSIQFLVSSQGGSESWYYIRYADLNHSNSQIKFSMWYIAS